MNPDADYKMVVQRQRRLEELAAARAGTEPRVRALLSTLASRLRSARA